MSNLEGGMINLDLWKLKKELCPKITLDPPMAKKNEKGNLISSPIPLMNLYEETYHKRLENKQIKPDLEDIKELKESLLDLRMDKVSKNKTPDWTMNNLERVLKSLKKKKARDPAGWINELFRPENSGYDLKVSILSLVNIIKKEQYLPKLLRSPDITSIYKKKGCKTDLNNDRGIFKLSILRTILDKLIYFDKIEEIDQNMSDSQIGARKNKNIRNHLFMIYGVQNELKQSKNKSVDMVFYDVEKMFDSQWTVDTMNDIFDVCDEEDDKLSLMYKSNLESFVSVNTPFGKTQRKPIYNIEMQGSVLGPIKASAHMDKIGKTALENTENLFLYKNMVAGSSGQ